MPVMIASKTNDEWLAALRKNPPLQEALADLREILRRGLLKALASRSDVTDTDADDFAQDALLRILEKLDSFRGDSKFTTWAISIAVRTALTALRRKSWGERSLEDLGLTDDHPATPQSPEPDAQAQSERHELLGALRRAVDTDLTPKQRRLILAKLAGMPSVEIAAQLDAKPNALYKLYHDARKRLRIALERDGFSADSVRVFLDASSHG